MIGRDFIDECWIVSIEHGKSRSVTAYYIKVSVIILGPNIPPQDLCFSCSLFLFLEFFWWSVQFLRKTNYGILRTLCDRRFPVLPVHMAGQQPHRPTAAIAAGRILARSGLRASGHFSGYTVRKPSEGDTEEGIRLQVPVACGLGAVQWPRLARLLAP